MKRLKNIFNYRYIPHSIGIFMLLALLVLMITPPEATLGNIVRLVFLHAALVQTGLLFFAAGTLFALIYFFARQRFGIFWALSVQETAVIIWTIYFVSSMFATYFSWGVWIAWDEPRTIASIKVLALSVLFLGAARWMKNAWVTAGLNLLMGLLAWILTKSAMTFRHPLNPIAHSNSGEYKLLFTGLFLLLLLSFIQFLRWRIHVNQRQ